MMSMRYVNICVSRLPTCYLKLFLWHTNDEHSCPVFLRDFCCFIQPSYSWFRYGLLTSLTLRINCAVNYCSISHELPPRIPKNRQRRRSRNFTVRPSLFDGHLAGNWDCSDIVNHRCFCCYRMRTRRHLIIWLGCRLRRRCRGGRSLCEKISHQSNAFRRFHVSALSGIRDSRRKSEMNVKNVNICHSQRFSGEEKILPRH